MSVREVLRAEGLWQRELLSAWEGWYDEEVASDSERERRGVLRWSRDRELAKREFSILLGLGLMTLMAGLVSWHWPLTKLLGLLSLAYGLAVFVIVPSTLCRLTGYGLAALVKGRSPRLPDKQYLKDCQRLVGLLVVARLDNLSWEDLEHLAICYLLNKAGEIVQGEAYGDQGSLEMIEKRIKWQNDHLFLCRFELADTSPSYYFRLALKEFQHQVAEEDARFQATRARDAFRPRSN